jgi:hypothetical protein
MRSIAFVLALVPCALSAQPAQPNFFRPDTIELSCPATADSYAPEMKPVDLNADGFTDLAFTCPTEIQVLLSNGKGGFTQSAALALSSPSQLQIVDVNGDGKPDITALTFNLEAEESTLSIFLGKGDGTFASPITVILVGTPAVAAWSDVNGDGKLDLLAFVARSKNHVGNTILETLLGNGDGTFQPPISMAVTSKGVNVATVGDFNGDGKPDVAFTALTSVEQNTPVTILVALGNGNGTFQAPQTAVQGTFAAGSVILASAVSSGSAPALFILEGTTGLEVALPAGGGIFGKPTKVGREGTSNFILADVNGDGFADLVLSEVHAVAGIRLGNGDGSFQAETDYPVGDTLAAGRFNAGTDLGLAGFSFPPSASEAAWAPLVVIPGLGNGKFDAPIMHTVAGTTYFAGLLVADFNGDGNLDVVSGADLVYGAGNGRFSSGAGLPPGFPEATADFNQDGKPDVILNTESNDLMVFLNTGNPQNPFSSTAIQTPVPVVGLVLIADFNGDGYPDLFTLTDFPTVSLNIGGDAFGPLITSDCFGPGENIDGIVIGDFNHDGKMDIAGPGGVCLGNGDGTFQSELLSAALQYINPLLAANFRGHGVLDIVAIVGTDSGLGLGVFFGNGDGTFQNPVVYQLQAVASGNDYTDIQSVDINGDNVLDIAFSSGGLEYFLLGNGDGTFTVPTSPGLPVGPSGASYFGDFFSHGLNDILTSYGELPTTYLVLQNQTPF